MEVDSSHVDREDDVPQCEFLFTAESDEDCGVTMDMGLIYVHLLPSIKQDDVGGRAVVLLILHLPMSSKMTRVSW